MGWLEEATESFAKVGQIITDEEAVNVPRLSKIKLEALQNNGIALIRLNKYADA